MDAAVIAEKQEADGIARQAQRDIQSVTISAGEGSDRKDQSDPARVGEILRCGSLESVFLVHSPVGREEDSAPSGPSASARRLRVEAMEQGMAIWHVGPLLRVPRIVSRLRLCSRITLIGRINLVVKCAGA